MDWQTPPEVIKALGKFDLDPCASTRQAFRTARVMWTKRQDGLSREWFGRVWLNPPFDPHLLPKFLTMIDEKLVFYRGARRSPTPRSHMDRSEALVAFGYRNTLALKRSGIGGELVT